MKKHYREKTSHQQKRKQCDLQPCLTKAELAWPIAARKPLDSRAAETDLTVFILNLHGTKNKLTHFRSRMDLVLPFSLCTEKNI